MSDYLDFRGKCKELAEAEIAKDATLMLVRGWYLCPVWGQQAHWWCKRENGGDCRSVCETVPDSGSWS